MWSSVLTFLSAAEVYREMAERREEDLAERKIEMHAVRASVGEHIRDLERLIRAEVRGDS